jgi:hypothetical protein
MLATTLQVLSGQAKYVGNDANRRRAFLKGLRSWRRQYGRQLALELATCFSTMRADQRQRKLRLLADHYPQGLIMLLLLRILPSLGRPHRAQYSRPQISLAGSFGAVLPQQLQQFDRHSRRSRAKPYQVVEVTLRYQCRRAQVRMSARAIGSLMPL